MTLENLVGKGLVREPTAAELEALTEAGRDLESSLKTWLQRNHPELLDSEKN